VGTPLPVPAGLDAFPGGDLVTAGLRDLADGRESVESLLVLIGAPRLRRAGLEVPATAIERPEHRLYEALAKVHGDDAHGKYNASIRRLVRFERAFECKGPSGPRWRPVDRALVARFLRGLARQVQGPTRLHLTGGVSAVLLGWRPSTLDIDLSFEPDRGDVFSALPGLEESLHVNVELAKPPDFVPELPGWEGRCVFVAQEGPLSVFHYDFSSQALSKIERGHVQDQADVRRMLEDGLVDPAELRRLFALAEPQLVRYPAIDPASLRRAIDAALAPFEGIS
jgi:hypothetical protein